MLDGSHAGFGPRIVDVQSGYFVVIPHRPIGPHLHRIDLRKNLGRCCLDNDTA